MYTAKKIKIGIIGANPERGWASTAHIPALKALPDYELSALSSRTKEDGEKLKATFGVPHVYDTVSGLIQSPEVDLVLITVRVPRHYELVSQAAKAGKHVFSEWPLARNLKEAAELAALVKKNNVKGFIGLQSRSVPAVRFIKDYIAQGNIGEVLSTSMIGSGIIYGEFTEKANDYTVNPENGAGMINVTFGNAVDALAFVLGEFTELSATTATRRKTTTIVESGEAVPLKIADQVAVTGILVGGVVASVHFRGGHLPGTNFLWEINGTKGDIQITADGGSLAVFELTVKASKGENSAMEILEIPTVYNLVPDRELGRIPTNVGQNYQLIQQEKAPTFDDALIRHRMIEAIEESARTGTRQSYRLSS
ncbi:Gfo/Idh/MocA family protein [Parapedobacter koreensis]|uniref:Predicted dehydrogenase n=1 Tax=Parapedobacter koreensis TaxID=332977 RepID=A0A1H7LUB9_9SPHI|nr:Gfo/Idh/MocA family oxidoreductase [Parapedobacter koreensis]SEL02556.1 Predicted dehydrogenase [Parapedobacter koreensis]